MEFLVFQFVLTAPCQSVIGGNTNALFLLEASPRGVLICTQYGQPDQESWGTLALGKCHHIYLKKDG